MIRVIEKLVECHVLYLGVECGGAVPWKASSMGLSGSSRLKRKRVFLPTTKLTVVSTAEPGGEVLNISEFLPKTF